MALLRSQGKIALFVFVVFVIYGANAAVFDVIQFGAKPDIKYDNNMAFTRAWVAACHATPPSKVIIPPGNYKASEVFFSGPCRGPVTVEVRGSIFASKDISEYPNGFWFGVEHVDGFKIDGVNFQGSFNGTGDSAWKYDSCKTEICESPLPANFYLNDVKNGDIGFLNSFDSKGYHFNIIGSSDVNLHNLNIKAPKTSPHTNAAHVVSSNNVKITQSTISTGGGQKCVLYGADSKNILNQVSCNNVQ